MAIKLHSEVLEVRHAITQFIDAVCKWHQQVALLIRGH